jgi:hypothetical protein
MNAAPIRPFGLGMNLAIRQVSATLVMVGGLIFAGASAAPAAAAPVPGPARMHTLADSASATENHSQTGSLARPSPSSCADPRPTTAYQIQDEEQAPTAVNRAPVLCEHRSGFHGAEPMAVVNSRGTLFLSAGGSEAGDGVTAVLRSRDNGGTWDRLPLPEGFRPHTAHLTVDAVTDRLFFTSLGLGAGTEPCGTPVGYSDDEGSTWHVAATRPGCPPYATVGDWPKIFTGPYTGAPVGSYPRAVYHCNTLPLVLTNPVIGCWRSDDGGDTFDFQSFLPTFPLVGACGARPASPVVHGTGHVDAAGVVRVPATACGRIGIMTSRDEARTWSWTDVGPTPFVGPAPSPDLDSPPLDNFFNGIIPNVLDEDSEGTLYLTWVNRVVQLAVSTDGGTSWEVRSVSPPGLRAQFPAVAANRAGEVALSYMATSGTGLNGAGHEWKAWMSYSTDADSPRPVFSSGAISEEPMYITPDRPQSCCFGSSDEDGVIFAEMTGVQFAPDGAVWAGFARFDQAGDGRAELVAGELRLPGRTPPR